MATEVLFRICVGFTKLDALLTQYSVLYGTQLVYMNVRV